jgi:hypothetical protein
MSMNKIPSCNWQYWYKVYDGWNCVFMKLLTQMELVIYVKWITWMNYDIDKTQFHKWS